MTDQTQAAAADADTQAKPGSEAEGARDTLEAALAEFDSAASGDTKPSDTKPETDKPKIDRSTIENVVAYIENDRKAKVQEAFNRDMSEAVKTVKGDLEIDDDLAEGWLYAKAEKDARVLKAFQQRGTNPDGWRKVLGGLKADFAKKFEGLPDREATEDRNAARAAVRSAATTRPEAPAVDTKKLNQMSDAEFDAYKRSLAG